MLPVMSEAGKLYELGYLLTPLLAGDKVAETVESGLKALILTAGGEIKRENQPRLITLAYPIKQVIEHKGSTFREAYFGSLYFEAPAEAISMIQAGLKKSPQLIRQLLIIVHQPLIRPEFKRPSRAKLTPAPAAPPVRFEKPAMTAEALDREIEDLLTAVK